MSGQRRAEDRARTGMIRPEACPSHPSQARPCPDLACPRDAPLTALRHGLAPLARAAIPAGGTTRHFRITHPVASWLRCSGYLGSASAGQRPFLWPCPKPGLRRAGATACRPRPVDSSPEVHNLMSIPEKCRAPCVPGTCAAWRVRRRWSGDGGVWEHSLM